MKILFLSSVFPNAIEPSRGCFNDSLVRALAIEHQVEVISPIPWVDLLKGHRRRLRVPMYQRIADPAGFGIHYVPFLYPPKILRSWYCDVLLVVDCGDGPVVDPDASPGADHRLLGAS